MDIGNRLRKARIALGKTQEQVALASKMHVTQYNGYERGRSRPATETLQRIAEALETTPAELLSNVAANDAAATPRDKTAALNNLREQFTVDVAALLGLEASSIFVRIEVIQ